MILTISGGGGRRQFYWINRGFSEYDHHIEGEFLWIVLKKMLYNTLENNEKQDNFILKY